MLRKAFRENDAFESAVNAKVHEVIASMTQKDTAENQLDNEASAFE
jgi:hypothetical protein